MDPKNVHLMKLGRVYPSGAEEWVCAECGRRILLQWNPKYSRIILEIGEQNAFHSGCRVEQEDEPGDARTAETTSQSTEPQDALVDRLGPWREWVNAHFC
jgi:hypothetical protein